jgi:hypothetical protein
MSTTHENGQPPVDDAIGSGIVAELEMDAQMACDLGSAEDGKLSMRAANEIQRLRRQLKNVSAIADIVDRNIGMPPNTSVTPDVRIGHQISGLLEALAHSKRESKSPNQT